MTEILNGLGIIFLYYIVCIGLFLIIRRFVKLPEEVFRKALHCILLGSLAVWTTVYTVWWHIVVTSVLFVLIVYPVLYLAGKIRGFSKTVVERKTGELKNSMVVVFIMFAVVTAVCWGWLGDRMLALASVYAWGFGDAAAALVGKRYGRHKIGPNKSVEGTAAMFLVSFISVLVILIIRGAMPWYGMMLSALAAAAVSAIVELYTPNGMDTIACPLAAMVVLLPLTYMFGVGL